MTSVRGRAAAALAAAAVSCAGLSACASAGVGKAHQKPPARMVQTGKTRSVLLTPLGAKRIGIQTAQSAIKDNKIVVPFSALLYEPDGRTAVYVQTGPLTYTRYFIKVADITAGQVFVAKGLKAGQPVVTVGAEELLGVQNGVGVET
jgi:hypothetical protein